MPPARVAGSRCGEVPKQRRLTVDASGAIQFIRRHGVVLESARGSVPALAVEIAGGPIPGSWWSHPRSRLIFALTRAVRESPDILTCRLIDEKVTFVHRRLWPSLVRLASVIDSDRLAAIREEHTAGGCHRRVETPYPEWVPGDILAAAKKLTEARARVLIGQLLDII